MTSTLVHKGLLTHRSAIPRRAFMRAIGLAAASSALMAVGIDRIGDSLAATHTATPMQVATPTMARTTFTPYVGDTFHVRVGPAEVTALELVKVRDLLSTHALESRGFVVDPNQSFSIQFRGPIDQPLPQDVYHVKHPLIGAFDLFIVPMRPEQDGRYYETIFNRVRDLSR